VRVQRVVMPWDAVSWTVLEDDGNPVGAVDRFLGFLSSSEKSPNTVKSYAHDLKDWFSYLSGRGLAWDEVTLEDVAAFVAWLRLPPQGRDGTVAVLGEQAHHCGASTVNRKLAAVASFYRFHARHGAKAAGVLRSIQAPGRGYAGTAFRPFLHHVTGRSPRPRLAVKVKAPRPLPRVLTVTEAQAILDACGHLRDRLLLAMLLEAGLRIGEALGMRHEDIDIGGCLVHVVPRDNANGMRAKGGRGRAVPAGAPLMRLYADYLNREYGAVDSDYVFVNLWAGPAGRPMTYPAAYDLVTRLRAATGIAFSPHWCRHTYATWFQMSGVASSASFGSFGERALPGPQRVALRRSQRDGTRFSPRDLGRQQQVASDAWMRHLIRLQEVTVCCSQGNVQERSEGRSGICPSQADPFSMIGTLLSNG
jgi:site-specific recombinase XerD